MEKKKFVKTSARKEEKTSEERKEKIERKGTRGSEEERGVFVEV